MNCHATLTGIVQHLAVGTSKDKQGAWFKDSRVLAQQPYRLADSVGKEVDHNTKLIASKRLRAAHD